MFVLDELDRILQNLAIDHKKKRDRNRLRITLPDVTRIVFDHRELDKLVVYSFDVVVDARNKSIKTSDRFMESNQNNLSSDSLFESVIGRMILPRLAEIPERHYPSAKLIICDRYSYNLLMKLKRTTVTNSTRDSPNDMSNFIYKPPNNVTAIFLLRDVVDMIDREQEPILVQRRDPSGKQTLQFNYSLIRRVFLYLKMSDLIIILRDGGKLDLASFDIKANREQQILQYLSYFARFSCLIEMGAISESIGNPHMIYDNVLISQIVPDTNVASGDSLSSTLRLPLVHLASMARKLILVLDKLSLRLSSISYRKNDPNGQTKLMAQIISTSLPTKTRIDHRLGRLIILDRHYDLQQVFLHADRYGPFLEQERQVRFMKNKDDFKPRSGFVDGLEDRLQLEKLTDVLGVILRYTANLKPKDLRPLNGNGAINLAQPKQSLANLMTSSQSIKRHLDIVKVAYKCLSDGYLLTLRLESSLEQLTAQLKDLREPMTNEQQDELVGKLQRVAAAFNQLIKISGKIIRPSDIIRVACVLIDTINLFFHKHTGMVDSKVSSALNDIKKPLLSKGYLKQALKVELDEDDGELKVQLNGIWHKLNAFDLLSREKCGSKSRESIEQILEGFRAGNLDQDFYPTTKLLDVTTNTACIVLVFLGSLTPNELGKIKALEANVKAQTKYFEILVMAYDLREPEDIMKLL